MQSNRHPVPNQAKQGLEPESPTITKLVIIIRWNFSQSLLFKLFLIVGIKILWV